MNPGLLTVLVVGTTTFDGDFNPDRTVTLKQEYWKTWIPTRTQTGSTKTTITTSSKRHVYSTQ